MVIFFFGNYMCLRGKRCEVVVSWCEGECTDIAAVQGDGPFELVLPC